MARVGMSGHCASGQGWPNGGSDWAGSCAIAWAARSSGTSWKSSVRTSNSSPSGARARGELGAREGLAGADEPMPVPGRAAGAGDEDERHPGDDPPAGHDPAGAQPCRHRSSSASRWAGARRRAAERGTNRVSAAMRQSPPPAAASCRMSPRWWIVSWRALRTTQCPSRDRAPRTTAGSRSRPGLRRGAGTTPPLRRRTLQHAADVEVAPPPERWRGWLAAVGSRRGDGDVQHEPHHEHRLADVVDVLGDRPHAGHDPARDVGDRHGGDGLRPRRGRPSQRRGGVGVGPGDRVEPARGAGPFEHATSSRPLGLPRHGVGRGASLTGASGGRGHRARVGFVEDADERAIARVPELRIGIEVREEVARLLVVDTDIPVEGEEAPGVAILLDRGVPGIRNPEGRVELRDVEHLGVVG